MIAEKERRLPGIIERRRDRVDDVRRAVAERALCFEDLRPLRRTAACELRQRMLGRRRHDARELAVLYPRRVEHLHAVEPVRKDYPLAVSIKTVIDEGLIRLLSAPHPYPSPLG